MAKKSSPRGPMPGGDAREAEAAKTTHLRALRLAKEAADKEVAAQEALAKPSVPRRRVRT